MTTPHPPLSAFTLLPKTLHLDESPRTTACDGSAPSPANSSHLHPLSTGSLPGHADLERRAQVREGRKGEDLRGGSGQRAARAVRDGALRVHAHAVGAGAQRGGFLACPLTAFVCTGLALCVQLLRPYQTRLLPRGGFRVSGRAHTPSWVYTGDGSRADSGIPPAASR